MMMVTRRNIFNNTGRASMLIVNPVMGVEDGSLVPNVMICFYYLYLLRHTMIRTEMRTNERTNETKRVARTQGGGRTKDGDILEDEMFSAGPGHVRTYVQMYTSEGCNTPSMLRIR